MRRRGPLLSLGTGGVAALEFALLAPVMLTMVFGLTDVAQAIITYRRVDTVSQQTAEVVTEMALQPDQTTRLTVAQLAQASTLIYAVFPELRAAGNPSPTTATYAVTVSNVLLAGSIPTGCVIGLNCTSTTAAVAWSVPLNRGNPVVRPCGVVLQVSASAPAGLTSLPSLGMTTLISATVVDVAYQYTPFFGVFVHGPITFRRTTMLPPRSPSLNPTTPYIYYDTSTNANVCPGFQ